MIPFSYPLEGGCSVARWGVQIPCVPSGRGTRGKKLVGSFSFPSAHPPFPSLVVLRWPEDPETPLELRLKKRYTASRPLPPFYARWWGSAALPLPETRGSQPLLLGPLRLWLQQTAHAGSAQRLEPHPPLPGGASAPLVGDPA